MDRWSEDACERAMKVQDAILRAVAKRIIRLADQLAAAPGRCRARIADHHDRDLKAHLVGVAERNRGQAGAADLTRTRQYAFDSADMLLCDTCEEWFRPDYYQEMVLWRLYA